LQYLKFTLSENEFIVDTVKLSEATEEEECIGAETATSMMCHQPNMEFANNDPIYQLHDFANSSLYRAENLQKMPGVTIGLADLYCEDSLVDCDFLHKSRGHCNLFQEFRLGQKLFAFF
uniref:DBR1 domain-containing protein n=1 Tax=Onchocerca flexuosa TaxID=387005 RepID=A0A183HW28_9BILA